MTADPATLARALDWVHRRLTEQPTTKLLSAVEEAAQKFDLGPLDEEWLVRRARDRQPPARPG